MPVSASKLAVIFPVLALAAKDKTSSPDTKFVMDTVTFNNVALSTSDNVMPEFIMLAAAFSTYVMVLDTVKDGASLTAVILIVLCTTLLKLFVPLPSFATK